MPASHAYVSRKDHSQLQVRFCQPQDLVNRVLFLASGESKSINGAEMRMTNYKEPRQVEVMDALPTNASGKVLSTRCAHRPEPRRAPTR